MMSAMTAVAEFGMNDRVPDPYFQISESTEYDWSIDADWSLTIPIEVSQVMHYALQFIAPATALNIQEYVIQTSKVNNARRSTEYLTSFEVEDVMVSKSERKRGESKRFSRLEDLLTDLASE